MIRSARLLLSVFALCGCVRASFVQTGPERLPLPDGCAVRVYLTGAPAAGHEEIGVAQIKGGDLAARVDRAREEACRRGGNAIVLVGAGTGVTAYTSMQYATATTPRGATMGGWVPTTQVQTYETQTFAIVHEQQPMGGLRLSIDHRD